jgi:hypothetical protein
MNLSKKFNGFNAITKYLASGNERIQAIIESAANNVIAAVNQSVEAIRKNRDRISDAADHMDGEFIAELELSQKEEIEEISLIENEFKSYYNRQIWIREFKSINNDLYRQIKDLEKREEDLKTKEADIEKIIYARVADVKERIREESTSSRGLFKSALTKAEKVFDQNKITRFVYSTISRFQEDFHKIQDIRDVEYITKLFQETIQAFQKTRVVTDKDGKLITIIINQFSEDCYQDLFLFFYRYYNELTEIYAKEKALPSTAEEIARIFQKKSKEAHDIVRDMHMERLASKSDEKAWDA